MKNYFGFGLDGFLEVEPIDVSNWLVVVGGRGTWS